MRQRIIIHTPEPVSSPALYIEGLSLALAAEGVPLHVVCPANLQTRPAIESDPLVIVHPSLPRSTAASGFWGKVRDNLSFLGSSLAVLFRQSRRGDIIHFQYVLHFPFGALFFLVARCCRAKIVFTVHDPLPHKWLLPKALRGLERRSLAWAYKTSDSLIVHSEPGKRALIEHFEIDAEKIAVVVHGPYSLGRGSLPMPESKHLELLLFGALRENKGAHLAIEAVQQVFREGMPVRLTIAGSVLNRKEEEYWKRCRSLIANCPDPIRLLEGFVPDEQVPELLASCHCLLLPYTQFFSDSGVAFMALANGRPIISTRAGGLGSLLDASSAGIAIEEATVNSVSEAIRKAVGFAPKYFKERGDAGLAWVLEECGWPKVARLTRDIYRKFSRLDRTSGDSVAAAGAERNTAIGDQDPRSPVWASGPQTSSVDSSRSR